MSRATKLALTLSIPVVLAACASGVTRMDSSPGLGQPSQVAGAPKKIERNVKAVNVWLNEDAKKLVADNLSFNPDTLRSTVERLLSAQGLIRSDAGQTLDIEVTSFRVRSSFSAIMWGFMAGNDNVEGVVTVKDAAGNAMKKAKVNASWAFGGVAGGQDAVRLGWLYEQFAKHTAAELTGATE